MGQRGANLFLQEITHGDPLLLLVTLIDRVTYIRANRVTHQCLIGNLL